MIAKKGDILLVQPGACAVYPYYVEVLEFKPNPEVFMITYMPGGWQSTWRYPIDKFVGRFKVVGTKDTHGYLLHGQKAVTTLK